MSRSAHPTYYDRLGNPVPSVTTIIGRFKDSGALLYWANKVGREGKTLNEARDPAALAGTLAHQLVEAHLRGQAEPVLEGDPDAVAKARAAFEAYLRWEAMVRVEIMYAEVALVSERYKFGGRLDAIAKIGGDLALMDWKTANAIYVDYTLQLAAYQLLWEESYPDHPLVGGFHLCRFSKEDGDFSHHYFPRLEKEAIAFLKMRELYDLMKECERRVK